MIKEINEIIAWNIACWNTKETYNRHLETSMLSEELAETIIALKEGNKIEAVDGILDLFWIWIWTLYKLWVTSEQISKCFEEISASNYSKLIQDEIWTFHAVKDYGWKVLKPDTYFKPNLEQFFVIKVFVINQDFVCAYSLEQAKKIYCDEFDFAIEDLDYYDLFTPDKDWVYHYDDEYGEKATMTQDTLDFLLKEINEPKFWLI